MLFMDKRPHPSTVESAHRSVNQASNLRELTNHSQTGFSQGPVEGTTTCMNLWWSKDDCFLVLLALLLAS